MLRTLHTFLARELAKVTLLALVAFTLVMTVFAIIEPLRKQGLATDQVLALFGYTLPVMVSLTLPIAALFAATIVYGRMSQDNEVTACRASGISAVTLLKPAWVLGLVVTAVSLWLSNAVAPQLAQAGALAVKANVRGILYHELRTNGYFKYQAFLLRADEVYPDQDLLKGVVFAYAKEPNNVLVVAMPTVHLVFPRDEANVSVLIEARDPVVTRSGAYDIGRAARPPIDALPLPNPVKEDPAWYSWDRLVGALDHPAEGRDIQRELKKITRDLAYEMLATEIAEAINAGRPYDRLAGPQVRCEIQAAQAVPRGGTVELRSGTDAQGRKVPVRARVSDPLAVRIIEADEGRVQAGTQWDQEQWSSRTGRSVVSVELKGNVRSQVWPAGEDANRAAATPPAASAPSSRPASGLASSAAAVPAGPADSAERDRVQIGGLTVPDRLLAAVGTIDPNELLAHVEEFSSDPDLRERVNNIRLLDIPQFHRKVLAEIHARIAYGLSCFLLVAMGAGLGVRFRGGQMISAFALSVVPGAIVVVLLLMGKEMVRNPSVPKGLGLVSIWAGIAALAAGNALLYVRLSRR